MLAKVNSFGLTGITGYLIEVETDIHNGMPSYETVGLADTAVKESRERIRSAIKNNGFEFPISRITVNLAPADTKKSGSFFDLPIAVGILSASEQVDFTLVKDYIFLGELSLDGRVRHINGILPVLISVLKAGYKKVVIPKENEREASFVEGLEVYAVKTLSEAVKFLKKEIELEPVKSNSLTDILSVHADSGDFKFVKGQYGAKRALEIAAAGGHNVIMTGPPGSGKTMLARALPSILPKMTPSEALETTKIHSVAGKLDLNSGIVSIRPFRTPHHTASMIALTGGGMQAKPGEVSLAHNGILFLDELPEYGRKTLETLRQPLEDRIINISRAQTSVEYPADFMLVASMNPCPCGYYGSTVKECNCSLAEIQKYLKKLSGPLMDRIDLHIPVDAVEYSDLSSTTDAESSQEIALRVDRARDIQTKRFEGTDCHCNASMNSEMLKKYCALPPDGEKLLENAFTRLKLSARAYSRILKVARTIADLEEKENITSLNLMEALQFRGLDKKL